MWYGIRRVFCKKKNVPVRPIAFSRTNRTSTTHVSPHKSVITGTVLTSHKTGKKSWNRMILTLQKVFPLQYLPPARALVDSQPMSSKGVILYSGSLIGQLVNSMSYTNNLYTTTCAITYIKREIDTRHGDHDSGWNHVYLEQVMVLIPVPRWNE